MHIITLTMLAHASIRNHLLCSKLCQYNLRTSIYYTNTIGGGAVTAGCNMLIRIISWKGTAVMESSSVYEAGMDSPEYEAVFNCYGKLHQLMKRSHSNLIPSLVSKRLISQDTEEKTMQNGITDSNKVLFILEDVRSSVRLQSTHFQDFIEVLQEDPYYNDGIDLLQKELSMTKSKRDERLASLESKEII